MAVNFTTTSGASRVSGVKAIVYGPAGIGKSLLAATAPAPLIISIEKGLMGLNPVNIAAVFGANAPGISYDFPVAEITSFSDTAEILQAIRTSPHFANFQTIVLDSISDIAEVCLDAAKRQVKDPRQAYGQLADRVSQMIRDFRDLPGKNVYFTAKLDTVQDENGAMMFGPSMPGKQLTQALPHFLDEVFYMGVSEKNAQGQSSRYLLTKPNPKFYAKDRSGALVEYEEPHLGKIFAKIKNR